MWSQTGTDGGAPCKGSSGHHYLPFRGDLSLDLSFAFTKKFNETVGGVLFDRLFTGRS